VEVELSLALVSSVAAFAVAVAASTSPPPSRLSPSFLWEVSWFMIRFEIRGAHGCGE
jgi:hypothetical protein